ncbi:MAG TPA: PhoH family protein [Tepidisphaeraceae bacterium]|jgi:PhoH-like ATPase
MAAPAAATQSTVKSLPKTFVLDTNILLHNPNAMFMLADNEVIIPFDVLEELDTFKTNSDDLGRSARTAIRHLDGLREQGNLHDGIPIAQTGGTVRVVMAGDITQCPMMNVNSPDNRILCSAYTLQQQGKRVVFITKDINARIKADSMGVSAEDFEATKIDFDKLYSGWREIEVEADQFDTLYTQKQLILDLEKPLLANEFVLLRDAANADHTAVARFKTDVGALVPLRPRRGPVFGITHRNLEQQMALDLLLDDSIRLVSLIGSAGTGKTLLALAAGMHKVLNEQSYVKLLCARPIMPLGRDIGYLPGDKDDKLRNWMQPIFDNMSYLLSNRTATDNQDTPDKAKSHAALQNVEQRMQALVDGGQVVMEPLTYIRGRSIPHQFMIVDESQNLTPHEVKTIASRVGEGTKLVLTGDATQIDNPYLDSSSNGLSYLVERLKGKGIVGHITLAKSERSELASLVTEIL